MVGAPGIRGAQRDDYEGFARLFAELGIDDPVPERVLWERDMAPDALVIEDGGRLVGYLWAQPFAGEGYVRHLMVDPSVRRQGHGRRLMLASAAGLLEQGCSRWRLNVLADNAAAIALYEELGLTVVYATTVVRLPWEAVDRLPAPTRAPVARAPRPEEDAALETTFDLASGELARLRLPGQVLLALWSDAGPEATPLGMARFNPSFPGVFPFRATEPTLARPLLEALRPHAHGDLRHVQVVAERDTALAHALIAAGATVRHRILHLRGPIPVGPPA